MSQNSNTTNGNGGKNRLVRFTQEPSIAQMLGLQHTIVHEDEPSPDSPEALTDGLPLRRNLNVLARHVDASIEAGYTKDYAHPTMIHETGGLDDKTFNTGRYVLTEVARGVTSGNDVSTYQNVLGPLAQTALLEPIEVVLGPRAAETVIKRLRSGVSTSVLNHKWHLADEVLAQLCVLGPAEAGKFVANVQRLARRTWPHFPDISFRAAPIKRTLLTGLIEIRIQDLLASASHLDVPELDWWDRAKAFNLDYHRLKMGLHNA